MRIALLPLICCSSLALLGNAAYAQKARCMNANGVGYECSGSAARASEQSALSGPGQQRSLHIDFSKVGQHESNNLSQYKPGSSAAPAEPVRRKSDLMDAWPSALPSDLSHKPRP
ncbi:MAG: hypothetical protein LBE30_07960 [Comamonas sp.]|jgi:hypothetical protein|nr:hypothetical protein [Comamonas sp.]